MESILLQLALAALGQLRLPVWVMQTAMQLLPQLLPQLEARLPKTALTDIVVAALKEGGEVTLTALRWLAAHAPEAIPSNPKDDAGSFRGADKPGTPYTPLPGDDPLRKG